MATEADEQTGRDIGYANPAMLPIDNDEDFVATVEAVIAGAEQDHQDAHKSAPEKVAKILAKRPLDLVDDAASCLSIYTHYETDGERYGQEVISIQLLSALLKNKSNKLIFAILRKWQQEEAFQEFFNTVVAEVNILDCYALFRLLAVNVNNNGKHQLINSYKLVKETLKNRLNNPESTAELLLALKNPGHYSDIELVFKYLKAIHQKDKADSQCKSYTTFLRKVFATIDLAEMISLFKRLTGKQHRADCQATTSPPYRAMQVHIQSSLNSILSQTHHTDVQEQALVAFHALPIEQKKSLVGKNSQLMYAVLRRPCSNKLNKEAADKWVKAVMMRQVKTSNQWDIDYQHAVAMTSAIAQWIDESADDAKAKNEFTKFMSQVTQQGRVSRLNLVRGISKAQNQVQRKLWVKHLMHQMDLKHVPVLFWADAGAKNEQQSSEGALAEVSLLSANGSITIFQQLLKANETSDDFKRGVAIAEEILTQERNTKKAAQLSEHASSFVPTMLYWLTDMTVANDNEKTPHEMRAKLMAHMQPQYAAEFLLKLSQHNLTPTIAEPVKCLLRKIDKNNTGIIAHIAAILEVFARKCDKNALTQFMKELIFEQDFIRSIALVLNSEKISAYALLQIMHRIPSTENHVIPQLLAQLTPQRAAYVLRHMHPSASSNKARNLKAQSQGQQLRAMLSRLGELQPVVDVVNEMYSQTQQASKLPTSESEEKARLLLLLNNTQLIWKLLPKPQIHDGKVDLAVSMQFYNLLKFAYARGGIDKIAQGLLAGKPEQAALCFKGLVAISSDFFNRRHAGKTLAKRLIKVMMDTDLPKTAAIIRKFDEDTKLRILRKMKGGTRHSFWMTNSKDIKLHDNIQQALLTASQCHGRDSQRSAS